jgi:hypothetical protein
MIVHITLYINWLSSPLKGWYTPLLGTAYVLCYALTGIFEQPLTKEEGRRQLRAWKELVKKSGLSCFNSFLKTLDKWMDEITNYFVDRHSSGFVEGLNNKIKVIKRGVTRLPRFGAGAPPCQRHADVGK